MLQGLRLPKQVEGDVVGGECGVVRSTMSSTGMVGVWAVVPRIREVALGVAAARWSLGPVSLPWAERMTWADSMATASPELISPSCTASLTCPCRVGRRPGRSGRSVLPPPGTGAGGSRGLRLR